jgi:hypothetical protein
VIAKIAMDRIGEREYKSVEVPPLYAETRETRDQT